MGKSVLDDDDEVVIKKALKKKRRQVIPKKHLLSSGSTMMNLASTGRTAGCWVVGHYYWFVGDSDSGKTFLALTTLAEACINPAFDEYAIVYDNSEEGALMDIEKFFGPAVARRLVPPDGTREEPIYSKTTEQMYFNIDTWIKKGKPFIYIEDSIDVLDTEDDTAKFEERKKAYEREKSGKKAKEVSGSYGMSKPKINSQYLKRVVSRIHKIGAIVIIISQTRDNVGPFAKYDPKTAGGGRALKFYATLQVWASQKTKILKRVKGKNRQLGILAKVRLRKNRITGKDRTILVPIYHSFGIDDTGSCVDYLIEEGALKINRGVIKAIDFEFEGDKEEFIKHIENNNLESKLRLTVKKVWDEIETDCEIRRKPRYGQ